MKSGIDYFPLDVALDAKFELIEAEFGLTGFGVIVHLLQDIYGKAGYYIEWTTEVALLFAHKVGLGGGVVSEIVEASIRRGMFDKEKYDKYQVLTSKGIQKRYFEAVSRRKVLEVDYNILLVDVAQICPNANIQAKNVNIFSENAGIPKQSKVKESKVEKSKVNKDTGGNAKRFAPPSLAEIQEYAMEIKSSVDPQEFYDFYTSNGWKVGKNGMKDWPATFRNWGRRRAQEKPRSKGMAPKTESREESAAALKGDIDWLDDFLAKQDGGEP